MRPSAILFACLLAAAAVAGEALPRPEVPDPVGLGYRLALIDLLRERKVEVPAGASEEQLIRLYWERVDPAGLAKISKLDEIADDPAAAADRRARLRRTLQERYQVEAPADADEDALVRLLRKQREREHGETQARIQALADGERAGGGGASGAGSRTPAVPATAGDAAADGVRTKMLRAWQALQGLPVRWTPIWRGPEPADGAEGGTYRIKRSDGSVAIVDQLPPDDRDVASAWIRSRELDRASGKWAAAWRPMSWIAEQTTWSAEDPEILRWTREDVLQIEWLEGIGIATGDIALGDRWWRAVRDYFKAQELRSSPVGSGADAEAAAAACRRVGAEVAAKLAIDDPWAVMTANEAARRSGAAYVRWRLGAAGAATTEPDGWAARVQAIMSANAATRELIRASMAKLAPR